MKKGIQSLLIFFLFLLFSSLTFAYDEHSSCVKCHSDKELLSSLGYPQLYLDPKKVDEEVKMAGVPTCVDCHLGNSETMDKDEAHKEMPRPFYAAIGKNHKYEAVSRKATNFDKIEPKGDDRTKLLLREGDKAFKEKNEINKITQLFYHDHDPKTMAYSPLIANKTCGKCHEQETTDYNNSGMGLNKYQRGFTSFATSPPGPQNCGPWFGDNYEKIANECTKDFTEKMSAGLNRGCNKCHASCNDCHYKGFEKSEARHLFSKNVDTLSCYGSGKGTVCHAGPMDRRRGAGYLREEFAFPYGELPQDAHAKAGLNCVDCHKMENHTYGHLSSDTAKNSCSNCHSEIVEAVKASSHRNVDCTSCHIKEVGAYQFTFWGPGKSEGQFNLYTKHKEYYGTRDLPMIVKHPETGIFIPVKPYPMGAMNIKKDVKPTKLMVREINKTEVKGNTKIGEPETFTVKRRGDQVNDMYVITGMFKGYKNNDNMLAWIQMDKMSHSIGEARDCKSCHSSNEQKMTSWFTYNNNSDIKKPFSGSYIVTANKNGLTFSEFKYSKIEPIDGRNIDDFAPFVYTPNAWNVKGLDFSIPFNKKVYEEDLNNLNIVYAEIHNLKMKFKKDPEKVSKLNLIMAVLYHNIEIGKKMLEEFKKVSLN